MSGRDPLIGDVVHVPKNGTVHEEAEPATADGLLEYAIECRAPDSGGRSARPAAIPGPTSRRIEGVAAMWVDGTQPAAGEEA